METTQPPTPSLAPPGAADGPLRVGELFGETFGTWLGGSGSWLALSAGFHLPLVLVAAGFLSDGRLRPSEQEAWGHFDLWLGGALRILLAGAISYGAIRRLRGEPVGVGRSLSAALVRTHHLLGVAMQAAVITFLALLPVATAAAVAFVDVEGGVEDASTVATLAIVLGLCTAAVLSVVKTRYVVAAAVVVVERQGASAGMRHSVRLTAGSRWRIFAVVALVAVVTSGAQLAVPYVTENDVARLVVPLALGVVAGSPLDACLAAVCFQRLKLRKDGVDVSTVADVFA